MFFDGNGAALSTLTAIPLENTLQGGVDVTEQCA